jgi:hypothetical protein
MNDAIAPRPLGSDRTFWCPIDQNYSVHVTFVAQVTGPTTVDAWRAALNEV